jgi:hypothetical protein
LACVCDDKEEALEYIHENMDVEDMSDNEILSQPEVFAMNDGRYLIVEG